MLGHLSWVFCPGAGFRNGEVDKEELVGRRSELHCRRRGVRTLVALRLTSFFFSQPRSPLSCPFSSSSLPPPLVPCRALVPALLDASVACRPLSPSPTLAFSLPSLVGHARRPALCPPVRDLLYSPSTFPCYAYSALLATPPTFLFLPLSQYDNA